MGATPLVGCKLAAQPRRPPSKNTVEASQSSDLRR